MFLGPGSAALDQPTRTSEGPGVAFAAMFQRTALPNGPRGAFLPACPARGRSDRRLCPCGVAARDARAGRRRPFHGARHLQGDARLPDDERPIPGGRGCRRQLQRRDRPRVDTSHWARLLDARGRAGVRRPGRASVVRPLLRDADIARERDIIVEEIRSYRDDPGQVRLQPLRPRVLWRHTARLGDRGRRRDRSEGPARNRRSSGASWSSTYRPANTGRVGGR